MHKNVRLSIAYHVIGHPDKAKSQLHVLPAGSDSDFLSCLQSCQRLLIDMSLVYGSCPQD